ncbi:MAG: DUF1579 domain-containing protein [Planctomycetes bacterium]|nr:DUF1579 domain-containing protein [Planctomycetota bacterium]
MRIVDWLVLPVLLVSLIVGCAATERARSQPLEPAVAAEWLQRFVGEWTSVAEVTLEPGGDPMRFESTESVRAIGRSWIVAESHADADGQAFTSLLTIGFDERAGAIVGTWIDSMQPYLWHYEGRLDVAHDTLTLESVGPSMGDPKVLARYRDVFELDGTERKVLTSSVQGDDGQWTTFMRSEYRRKH